MATWVTLVAQIELLGLHRSRGTQSRGPADALADVWETIGGASAGGSHRVERREIGGARSSTGVAAMPAMGRIQPRQEH